MNGFLKWQQSTEDGYSQVSVMFGRLHRSHGRTASPFSAEVGGRGTVIIQKGKELKLNIKFYGQKKKILMGPKNSVIGEKELCLFQELKQKKENSSFRFTAQNLM